MYNVATIMSQLGAVQTLTTAEGAEDVLGLFSALRWRAPAHPRHAKRADQPAKQMRRFLGVLSHGSD